MTFSAQDVVTLRQKTGAGMMECKGALKETNGDIEKAAELLRQKGLAQAAKKSDKSTAEGIVISKVSPCKKVGAILEINSQTDFVAKNEIFIELANKLINLIIEKKPSNVEELLKLSLDGVSVKDQISSCVAKTGENIQLKRFKLFEVKESGIIGTYIHPVGNKIGVLVKITANSSLIPTEIENVARDISMHIAAVQPQAEYLDKSFIPKDVVENEKRIELGKEDIAKKPKEIAEKIVQGRLEKLFAQRCLLEQPFIKDPQFTIAQLVEQKGKQHNVEIKITDFIRYNVGESLDKSNSTEKETLAV